MTPDNMITMIKGRMANSNDPSLDSLIIAVANQQQEKLEQEPELPWFLEKDTDVASTNLVTVAGAETVDLPSDYLRLEEERDSVLFVQDTSQDDPWVPLTRDDYSAIKARYTGSGQPEYFDLYGSKLYLRKIPDAVYTLRLMYKAKANDIAAGTTENSWMANAADWIMAETGLILTSSYVTMPAIAQQYEKEALRARKRVMDDTVARREAAMYRAMGEN